MPRIRTIIPGVDQKLLIKDEIARLRTSGEADLREMRQA